MTSISSKLGLMMAFVAGFVIMATELLATPLLAPAFGTSLPVWAVVISMFLLALSIGYALGGRLADKASSIKPLAAAWCIAALLLLLAPMLARAFFPGLGIRTLALGDATVATVIATFIGMLMAMVMPMVLLSMTSPFLIGYWQRLRPDHPGALTGRVYAVGTIGSFLGVIVGPLVGMPLIGTRSTLFVLAGIVAIIGLWHMTERMAWKIMFCVGIILIEGLLLWWSAPIRTGSEVVTQKESYLQYIAVTMVDGELRLEVNEALGVQSSFVANQPFSGNYVDVFALLPFRQPPASERNALLIGLAGGAIPRAMQQTSAVTFEAVEFDPVIDQLARDYFALNELTNVNTTIGDGRVVLRQHTHEIEQQERKPYEYVFVDAFQNETTVPSHLMTQEWFQEAADILTSDGLFAMNLVTLDREGALATRTINTLASVFSQVYVIEVPEYGNLFLIATNNDAYTPELSAERRLSIPDALQPMVPAFELASTATHDPQHPIFTDDKAPTSLLTANMVWGAIQK